MSCSESIIYGRGLQIDTLGCATTLKFIHNHAETAKKVLAQLADKNKNKINFSRKALSLLDTCDFKAMQKIETNYGIWNDSLFDEYESLLDTWEELTKTFYNERLDATYLRELIADIITKETKVRISYERAQADECRGDASLILPETMPWYCNPTERKLTQESFDDLLAPYAKELGYKKSDIDDLLIEYYG